jgi:predicted kinase
MSTQQTSPKLFIQMSGAPGSGKSTVARLLGPSIGGLVIDHDLLRSRLLDDKVPFYEAAKLAYGLQWALAKDFMDQGYNVIIDSTCNFAEVLNQGSACAKQHSHAYWYVECNVQDINLLDERLRTRVPITSQRTGVDCPPPAAAAAGGARDNERALFRTWMKDPCRPKDNAVIVESTGDPKLLRDEILKRIVS